MTKKKEGHDPFAWEKEASIKDAVEGVKNLVGAIKRPSVSAKEKYLKEKKELEQMRENQQFKEKLAKIRKEKQDFKTTRRKEAISRFKRRITVLFNKNAMGGENNGV